MTDRQAAQLADTLAAEVIAANDSAWTRITSFTALVEKYGVETAYTISPNNSGFNEPKKHYAYEIDYDFSRILFLVCNDTKHLSTPNAGRQYGVNDLMNYRFEGIKQYERTFGFKDMDSLKRALAQDLHFYYSNNNASIDSIKDVVKENTIKDLRQINKYDFIVFVHFLKYAEPFVESMSTNDVFNSYFSPGYLKSDVIVCDLYKNTVIAQFAVENSNTDNINVFYNKSRETSPSVTKIKRDMEENLINTLKWRLAEMLAKRGIAPKRKKRE